MKKSLWINIQSSKKKKSEPPKYNLYVNNSRLNELKNIRSSNFDLAKLIKLCEELNLAYTQEMNFSTAMLVRAILDHIPPIFRQSNFTQVVSNHGTKSCLHGW